MWLPETGVTLGERFGSYKSRIESEKTPVQLIIAFVLIVYVSPELYGSLFFSTAPFISPVF